MEFVFFFCLWVFQKIEQISEVYPICRILTNFLHCEDAFKLFFNSHQFKSHTYYIVTVILLLENFFSTTSCVMYGNVERACLMRVQKSKTFRYFGNELFFDEFKALHYASKICKIQNTLWYRNTLTMRVLWPRDFWLTT